MFLPSPGCVVSPANAAQILHNLLIENTLSGFTDLSDCPDHSDGGTDDDEERKEESKGEKKDVVTPV